jgi:hypothetical protein
MNVLFSSGPEHFAGLFHVIIRLQPHPHLNGRPKVPREAQRCIRCDSALPLDNLVHAAGEHPDVLRQTVLANPHWFQKVFEQNLAQMDWGEFVRVPGILSVIIHTLNARSIARAPHKTETPLIIDAHAVLASTVALSCLQAIGRREAETCQVLAFFK